MAKSRYSKSKKGKSRRGKRSRHTKRHTRRRVHRGGYTPGPPTIPIPLRSTQLLSGLNYQGGGGHNQVCPGGGVQQPTGGSIAIKGLEITSRNPACGRA